MLLTFLQFCDTISLQEFGFGAVMSIFKTLMNKIYNNEDKKSSLESVIGEKCVVTERIDNFAGCGQVKVNGQGWSARGAYDDDSFEVGETLRIVALEGVKLICKK